MITEISHTHTITIRKIEQTHNSTIAGVQTAVDNNSVKVANSISLDIKTTPDKIINQITIIEGITGADPLAEACNPLEEHHVTTGVDLELGKVRKELLHIPDIQNKTLEVADVRRALMTCHALQDNVGQLP